MTMTANLADGRVLNFPDGTDPAVIQATVKRMMQSEAQQAEALQPQPLQERSLVDDTLGAIKGQAETALGVGENILSLGANMALEPIAGIAGLAQTLNPFADEGAGAEAVKAVQGLAFSPKTGQGQAIQQGLGEGIKAAGDFATENITKPLGVDDLSGDVLDATGSPALATIVGIMPELALEVIPAMAAGGKIIKSSRKARGLIADRIKAGDIDTGNIAKALDANGGLIKNPNIKKAIKLMGDDGAAYNTAINFEKMDGATRKQVNKMLDVIEKNKISGDPVDIMRNRPSNVIGESIANRVNKLDKIKKSASANIGRIINGDVGAKRVNIVQAKDDFMNALREADIKIGTNKDGGIITDASRTLTNIDEVIKPAKLDNILNRIESGNLTAKEAHKMKRNLREMVSFDPSKPGGVKVSAEIETAVKKLSSDLGDSVSQVSSKYKKSNKVMSDSIDALKKADNALGNKLMIGDDLAEAKFGALSKRIGTNLASKEAVVDLVKSLDGALAKRGIKGLDDVERQVAALADLEKIFKVESAQSPFGFQSRIAQGVAEGSVSPTKAALDFTLDKFRSMTALEFDDKMKALRALSKTDK